MILHQNHQERSSGNRAFEGFKKHSKPKKVKRPKKVLL